MPSLRSSASSAPRSPVAMAASAALTRRSFSDAVNRRRVPGCTASWAAGGTTGTRPGSGSLEALLRKEGIYSSHLASWRRQFGGGGEAGLTPRKPGRKPKLDAKARELLKVTKEVEALKRKLRIANALIDLQKKAHELLGLTLPEAPEEES